MPNARISLKDRGRLVRSYEEGRDWRRLAQDLDIKRTTAEAIIKRFVTEERLALKPRGGAVRPKMSQEMLNALRQFLEEKPTMTLREMKEKLEAEFPELPTVTTQAISRRLDGTLCITLKDARRVHEHWNSDITKEARFHHMHWFMETGIFASNIIYMDEFGCNLWTARTKGWAGVGERAVIMSDSQRGQNLTVVLAISPQLGLVHYRCHTGGFTGDRFKDFVSEVSALVDDSFVMLADNARPHGNELNLGRPDQAIRFLPPYSPFLNAAEMAISCWKADLKRSLTEPRIVQQIQDREAAAQAGETLQHRRLRILKTQVEAASDSITQDKCRQWHEFVLSYGPRCLTHSDIVH